MAEKLSMAKLAELIDAQAKLISDLTGRVEELETKRGPKSSREMTEDDARKILVGDMAKMSHKAAAEKLGLSYGQIYSCRGGYTFRKLHDEIRTAKMKK